MRIGTLGLHPLELRDHVLVVQDRACDQMREIGHEQRVMRQRIARDVAPVGIDQERDLREGVEGDADRQQDVDGDTGREQGIEVGGEEAGIFEDAEHEQVAGDAERQHRKAQARAQFPRDQQQADHIIERDRAEQQRHELPIAQRIEGERGQREPDHRSQMTAPPQHEIAEQRDRQEQKNERIGIEEHQAFPGGAEKPNHTTERATTQPLRFWNFARSQRYKRRREQGVRGLNED